MSPKYYKENRVSVTVLLSPTAWRTSQHGIILAKDMAPNTTGIYRYAATLPLKIEGGDTTGQFQIVVVEEYVAFGVVSLKTI